MGVIFSIIGCVFLLFLLEAILGNETLWFTLTRGLVAIAIGFAILLSFGALINSATRKPNNQIQDAEEKCKKIIRRYAAELIRKRRQLIKDQGYGIRDESEWTKEKQFFINAILQKEEYLATRVISALELMKLIDLTLNQDAPGLRANQIRPEHGNPIGFENYCASILEKQGWVVSTTKATGDQGADVLATKNGKTLVLQCKQYRGSVGNAAVQQAFSAMSHYGATQAAVVTESKYTQSAKDLASTTGVLLLGPEDLQNLA